MEKWKEEAQLAQAAKEEQVMHAATNYVKKIPTKKEMRAEAAKKVQSGMQPRTSKITMFKICAHFR